MSRKTFRHGRAIVKARAIETLVDPENPSAGIVNLICGHCGQMSSETIELFYEDPQDCGESHAEQVEFWGEVLPANNVCPECGVLNVQVNVERYLRTQRRLKKLVLDLDEPRDFDADL